MGFEGQAHSLEMTRFLRQLGRSGRGLLSQAPVVSALIVAVGFAAIAYGIVGFSHGLVLALAIGVALGGVAGYYLGSQLARFGLSPHREYSRWLLREGNLLAYAIDDDAYALLPDLGKSDANSRRTGIPFLDNLALRYTPVNHTDSFRRRLAQLLRSWNLCCRDLRLSPVPLAWRRRFQALTWVFGITFPLVLIALDPHLDSVRYLGAIQHALVSSRLVYWIIGLLLAPSLATMLADGTVMLGARRLALLDLLASRSETL